MAGYRSCLIFASGFVPLRRATIPWGKYHRFALKEFPVVPSIEGSAVIMQLGPDVNDACKFDGIDLKVGSRVVPMER